jgi:hypothetical protein
MFLQQLGKIFQCEHGPRDMQWGCRNGQVRSFLYEFLTVRGRLLIMKSAGSHKYFNQRKNMTDLIYIGVVVLFFVVSGLYVRACEKM